MQVKIGIDVGGTFTHAVAVDAETFTLVGKTKVPTTHRAELGVAEGIIASLFKLLQGSGIAPAQVTFIAHSTTQATNALLEGDVSVVGIVGMGKGLEGRRAKSETNVGTIEISEGKLLRSFHRFLDTTSPPAPEAVDRLLDELQQEGSEVIVASAAFSVEDPRNEIAVMERARARGLLVTGTHEISELYGLKVRTRTAVINASIMTKMMKTANATEEAVRRAGIKSPLMIVRSDGGVMKVDEVRKRPVLTLLSGPAAGVAAALMYLRISDGIFLEVGGTSTDISAIRDGKAMTRTATIGGHKTYLRTLDVRTLGIAGGSMIREHGRRVTGVGPRSAHIAGQPYVVFSLPRDAAELAIEHLSPTPGDPGDYLSVVRHGTRYALTTSCAANLLGLVPAGDPASGNAEAAAAGYRALGQVLGKEASQAAEEVLQCATRKIRPTVEDLLRDYEMDRQVLSLYGGGGGAAAIVPFFARTQRLKYELAKDADVISAIGAALAMVREVLEKSVVNPTTEDVSRIRQEAIAAAVRQGAAADAVEVTVEVDAKNSVLRAVATGATELRNRDLAQRQVDNQARRRAAEGAFSFSHQGAEEAAATRGLTLYRLRHTKKRVLGLFSREFTALAVVDQEGIVRMKRSHALCHGVPRGLALEFLKKLLDDHTVYGDGGALLPPCYLLFGSRIVDLSQLAGPEQMVALAQAELADLPQEEPVALVVCPEK